MTMQNIIARIKNGINWYKKTGKRNKILILAGVLILLFLGYRQFFASSKTPAYTTATVTKGTLIDSITESGNVSTGTVSVSSPTDGIVTEVYVRNGDPVSQGQNLFTVESTATPQEKASAYASYLNALNSFQSAQQSKQSLVGQLEQARQTVLNAQDAVDQMNSNLSTSQPNPSTKKNYTQNEIDSINSSLTSARENFSALETKYNQTDTSINAANASLNSASLSLSATGNYTVTAPTSGTVANLAVTSGQNISGGSTSSNSNSNASSGTSLSSQTTSSSVSSISSSNPVLLITADNSSYEIEVAANESDMPNLKPGQNATVTFDALPNKTYVATLDRIDSVGTQSSGVVTFNAYFRLVSPSPEIKSGMSATVVVQTARKDNVLIIPTAAVRTSNGVSTVRILQPNGQISTVEVQTGLSTTNGVEITSGLSEGQTVITGTQTTGSGSSSVFGGGLRFGGGAGGGATFRRVGGGG